MRGNQRQIVAIGCNRRPSEVKQRLLAGSIIESNQMQSEPTRANESQSETMSEAIKSNQLQSDAIRGKYQWSNTA